MNCWSPIAESSRLSVFICYRRMKEKFAVALIHEKISGSTRTILDETHSDTSLENDTPRRRVFIDDKGIPPGEDWRAVITREIRSSDVLLVLISEDWLTLQGEAGRRKLDEEDDFVRFEIETALACGIQIIPVLLDGAVMPQARELPKAIVSFAYRQGIRIRAGSDFYHDMQKLLDHLQTTESNLAAFHKERVQILAAVERGEWLLSRRILRAADAEGDLQGAALYRSLETLRSQAESLCVAADAIDKFDFKTADEALRRIDDAAPSIVSMARRLVTLGLRLSESNVSDASTIQAAEQEFQEIIAQRPSASGKVPGEREVRETLQRLLKDSDHQEAIRLYASARFAEAATKLEHLGDYKDSKDRLNRCTHWKTTLEAIKGHCWDDARRGLASLLSKPEEPRARDVQKWCAFARRIVPLLERIASGHAVSEERVLADNGTSPYVTLKVPTSISIQECQDLSFDLQSKGGMTPPERLAYDALRVVSKRLVVDFSLYEVKNPARAAEVLARHFGFSADDSFPSVLARIQDAVGPPPEGTRSGGARHVFDPTLPIVAELGDDGGLLYVLMRNYDAAIDHFQDQARRMPWNSAALHHLGLAARAKAHRDPDAHDVSDAWETMAIAWGGVFADSHFWDRWWALRRRCYDVQAQNQITAARSQLQQACVEELSAAAERDPEIAEVFRLEVGAARAVAALNGIPSGSASPHRIVVGPRGAAALRIDQRAAEWIATLPQEALLRESNERRVCVAFSPLASAQLLIDEGRFVEAIEKLEEMSEDGGYRAFANSPGFSSVAGERGRSLYSSVRRSLLQDSHSKAALAVVSEVPVDIDAAIRHWTSALALAQWLHNEEAIREHIRAVVLGRCQVLQNQEKEGRNKLDALNDAVKLVQDAIDQGWESSDERLRQGLVNALLDRAIHLSSRYDMEREARQDAVRAWGLAPKSLHAILVLCTASLYYAREWSIKGETDLAHALVKEVEERLADAQTFFPGNADLLGVLRATEQFKTSLANDEGGLERALTALRVAADDARSQATDGRLQQAMVLEAQSDFSRAADLYWELSQEEPGGEWKRRLSWCYRMWLQQLIADGDVGLYAQIAAEAKQRCPDAAALTDLVDNVQEGGEHG